MSKVASEQYVLERISEYLSFATNYMRLIREGKTDLAAEVLEDYEIKLQELETEAQL